MVQYVIKIYSVKMKIKITVKDIGLMQWIGVFYFLFILW